MPRRCGKKPLLQHIQTSGGSLWLHPRDSHRRRGLEMRACWAKYSESLTIRPVLGGGDWVATARLAGAECACYTSLRDWMRKRGTAAREGGRAWRLPSGDCSFAAARATSRWRPSSCSGRGAAFGCGSRASSTAMPAVTGWRRIHMFRGGWLSRRRRMCGPRPPRRTRLVIAGSSRTTKCGWRQLDG
jgi:hypothetical protein